MKQTRNSTSHWSEELGLAPLWSESRARLPMRRQRLFARIHPPAELIEGESYDVDLSVPTFAILWGGVPVSRATAQLIATHLEAKQEWLWGHKNSSISSAGVDRLAPLMSSRPAFATALSQDNLPLDDASARELAELIAMDCGYEAMYPAQVGEATAFLALDFVEHRGKQTDRPKHWCIGCGHLNEEQPGNMLGGPAGCGVCEKCAASPLIASLEHHEIEDPDFLAKCHTEDGPDAMYAHIPCGFCGTCRPRAMLPYSALCWVCIDQVRTYLGGRGPE